MVLLRITEISQLIWIVMLYLCNFVLIIIPTTLTVGQMNNEDFFGALYAVHNLVVFVFCI